MKHIKKMLDLHLLRHSLLDVRDVESINDRFGIKQPKQMNIMLLCVNGKTPTSAKCLYMVFGQLDRDFSHR